MYYYSIVCFILMIFFQFGRYSKSNTKYHENDVGSPRILLYFWHAGMVLHN